jgi:hypothetical protein
MSRLPHFEVGNKADFTQSTLGLVAATTSGLVFQRSIEYGEPIQATVSATAGLVAMSLTFLSEQRRESLKSDSG